MVQRLTFYVVVLMRLCPARSRLLGQEALEGRLVNHHIAHRPEPLPPLLLLLDEPAAGLNIYETQALAMLILKIRDRGVVAAGRTPRRAAP